MSGVYYLKSKNPGGGVGAGAATLNSVTQKPTSGGRPYQRLNRREASETVHLDFTKGPKDVIGEILRNISLKDGISKGKRLAYLNVLVKYYQYLYGKNSLAGTTGTSVTSSKQNNNKKPGKAVTGYDTKDICICLKVCLVHEATVIRIAGLRALRYVIIDETDIKIAHSIGISSLIVRSIDLVLNNSEERMQAIRYCQKILSVPSGPNHFPVNITRALIAIGFDGLVERDKLHRASLSLLCQLAILNAMLFIECGGVRVLIHNVLGCTSPMVLEGILGSLLHLLNDPITRTASGINLQSLVAPLTDLHFKHTGYSSPDRDVDERELGYRSSKIAIGTLLRSWSGLGSFCRSGLQALVDALYIEQFELRRTILDLICEIIGLKFPTWTDEVKVAVSAVDPSHPQDCWKLCEGFVVEEAMSIIPHLASTTPNITANHMALLLLSFVQRGLLEALVEVIVTSDTFLTVQGTVLLGELLSLVHRFLPVESFDPSQCIPSLIRYATKPASSPKSSAMNLSPFSSAISPQLKQQRAMEAITVLSALHAVKTKTPLPSSLFLQLQVSFSGYHNKNSSDFLDRLGEVQLSRILRKEIEQNPTKLLKETVVVSSKDPMSWHWQTIYCLLKWSPAQLRRVEDSSWRLFLKRLTEFYKPTNNVFGRIEISNENAASYVKVGCALLEFLAQSVQNFSGSMLLDEIVIDIATHLDDLVRHGDNVHIATWNPSKIETSLTQMYFLFIGKLSSSSKGVAVLKKAEILRRLVEVVSEVRHDYYVKLVVSSLFYGEEYCRHILTTVLSLENEKASLYATKFLRVLVRIRATDFSKWGIEMLVNQLDDKSKVISLAALDILEEAVHDKMFLESLIAIRPHLTHLGDRGRLMLVRFVSLPSGFKFLHEASFLENEISKWRNSFNKRYVELVEVLVRDSVSTLRRGEDGTYPERACKSQEQCKFVDIYVPPHLYGQLAQHKQGLDLLIEHGHLDNMIDAVLKSQCATPEETRDLKAALWALGHFGSSVDALPILEDSEVIHAMVTLGKGCPVLSVRHTVFHCLCLIATTSPGADALRKLGWYSMPRNHHENYPIWGNQVSNIIPSTLKRLRELDLDVDLELVETTESISSKPDILEQELLTEQSLTIEVDSSRSTDKDKPATSAPNTALTNGEDEDVVDNIGTSFLGFEDGSHRLSSMTSGVSSNASGNENSSFRDRRLGTSGSWSQQQNKSRSDSGVTESGRSDIVGSFNSSTGKTQKIGSPTGISEYVHTLSPIPSSSSISNTPAKYLSTSLKDSNSSGFDEHLSSSHSQSQIPNNFYRSIIRKPIIRLPTASDSDIYPIYPISPQRRMSLRDFKSSSLDRHIQLTPRDLFNESKLVRVNTSLTSLSTPSFRCLRQDPESKSQCFIGLCLPKDLNSIFIMGPEKIGIGFLPPPPTRKISYGLHLQQDSSNSTAASSGEHGVTVSNIQVQKEILRLVSSMISCIGAKTNEQNLLRLKQKYPKSFQDISFYIELCDLISQYNVRLPVRRFLQELFYDLCFDEFIESAKIVTGFVSSNRRKDPSQPQSLLEQLEEVNPDSENEYIDLK